MHISLDWCAAHSEGTPNKINFLSPLLGSDPHQPFGKLPVDQLPSLLLTMNLHARRFQEHVIVPYLDVRTATGVAQAS